MCDFDEIDSLKSGPEKSEKLTNYYKEIVKVDSWLSNNEKIAIIKFSDRTEYRKNNYYHRINGPAIDYNNDTLDKYYYKGKLFENIDEWKKITLKESRKIKIKRLKNLEIIENEKSSE